MKITAATAVYRTWKTRRKDLRMYSGNKGLFLETIYSIREQHAFEGRDEFVIAWLHEYVLSDYYIGSRRLDAVVNCIDIDWLWESELSQTLFTVDCNGSTYVFTH